MTNEKKRLLIIDDNAIFIQIFSQFLTAKDYHVDAFDDGPSGLQAYLAAREGYDLVLLDMQMPVMDGKAVLKNIRSQTAADSNSIPVIIMSGDSRADTDDDYSFFLQKPFQFEDALHAVQQILNPISQYDNA